MLRHRALLHLDNTLALRDLNEALQCNAEDVDALVLRASIYKLLGDKERSFLDLRRASIIAPQVRRLANAALLPSRAQTDRGLSSFFCYCSNPAS